MVRAGGLAESMSRYLIDRIAAAPNIELMVRTGIVGLSGDAENGLRRVRWRNAGTGAEEEAEIGHLFLFIGADPETGWLDGCGVALDRAGFILTGGTPSILRPRRLRRRRCPRRLRQARRCRDRRRRAGRAGPACLSRRE